MNEIEDVVQSFESTCLYDACSSILTKPYTNQF